MATGDIKLAYAASSNLTVTNLHSLAASQTWLSGWESAVIDNTTNLYEDYLVTIKLTTASANRQAGELRCYIFPLLDDSTYIDSLDGTESTESITTAGILTAAARLGGVAFVGSSNGEVAYISFKVASRFGGVCPAKFSLFITGNAATTTAAQLAASGNQVTIKGEYHTVAS